MSIAAVLQVGDWVHVDGEDHQVVALAGSTVRLRSASGSASVVLAAYLLSAADFALVEGATAPTIEPFGLLEGLPDEVVARARDWEAHLLEVITGWANGTNPPARAGYEPDRTTVQRRDEVKAAELTAAGRQVSTRTVRRLRLRYVEQGLLGIVDQRARRASTSFGRTDERLVAAIRAELDAQAPASSGTRGRLMRRVVTALEAEHGPSVVPIPLSQHLLRTYWRAVEGPAFLWSRDHPPVAGQPAYRGVHHDVRAAAR
jgi:putative transposase